MRSFDQPFEQLRQNVTIPHLLPLADSTFVTIRLIAATLVGWVGARSPLHKINAMRRGYPRN
jgi:hypothetical protein